MLVLSWSQMGCYMMLVLTWSQMRCYKMLVLTWSQMRCYKMLVLTWSQMGCYKMLVYLQRKFWLFTELSYATLHWLYGCLKIFFCYLFGVCILLSAWLYGCLKIYDIFILLLFVRSLFSTLCLIVCHYSHLYFDIWRRRSTCI
jgi:hypothetical protein